MILWPIILLSIDVIFYDSTLYFKGSQHCISMTHSSSYVSMLVPFNPFGSNHVIITTPRPSFISPTTISSSFTTNTSHAPPLEVYHWCKLLLPRLLCLPLQIFHPLILTCLLLTLKISGILPLILSHHVSYHHLFIGYIMPKLPVFYLILFLKIIKRLYKIL